MDDLTLPGIGGTLVSSDYAARLLAIEFAGRLGDESRESGWRALAAWWRRTGAAFGPATSVRRIASAGAAPVLEILGFDPPADIEHAGEDAEFALCRSPGIEVPLAVTVWGAPFDALLGRAATRARTSAPPWVFGFNGRCLRLWDTARGWSRAYLDADLASACAAPESFRIVWGLMRAEALRAVTREIVEASDRHGGTVRASLRSGVHEALELLMTGLTGHRRPRARERARQRLFWTFEQALTIVYRLLFLLFAEARGLVPTWHPVYRRSYSIDALRVTAERPGRHAGVWTALQAISRLAHAGCHAGDLVVAPFNGRLFAPGRAPLAESARLDDDIVARAVVALTTVAGPRGRERIAFADLGVEQLGAVYESVLDYEPRLESASPGPPVQAAGRRVPDRATDVAAPAHDIHPRVRLAGTGSRRKVSGTFYTPREMTDFVVRQALEPLVADASPDRILEVTVLDPAMGSGAFLVAACRYLAAAYERALVRERGRFAGDITDEERAGFRRLVAQRCLYGVDINPMAVQVARLSVWLATLAADKPLGFLDHRLAVGNSLVGTSPEVLAQRPPGGGPRRTRRAAPLPLFPAEEGRGGLLAALAIRHRLALEPDDTAETVRAKERALAELRVRGDAVGGWRGRADVWCAGWFWDGRAGPRPTRGEFADLEAAAGGRGGLLPPRATARRLAQVREIAGRHRFFHWPAEFPEVFYDDDGSPKTAPGFDAVVTNPPWEMLRNDAAASAGGGDDATGRNSLVRFVRESGAYSACDTGHANLYQVFAERCLQLARPGGRVGLIVPWGLAADRGSRALREWLLRRCRTDVIVGFENASGVFPIHRGVRFLLLSASPGAPTRATRCFMGLCDPAALDRLGAQPGGGRPRPGGAAGGSGGVLLTPSRLLQLSGDDLAFPYVRTRRDLRLLRLLTRAHPALGARAGWGLAFGRELNATDDRGVMSAAGPGMPVVEGKHLEPFLVRVPADGLRVRSLHRLQAPAVRRAVGRWRLGCRDVAASTNRLTLIAALIPPGHVTVHTVLCVKSPPGLRVQAYLCAMLNSFVANFLVRCWVTVHVGAHILARLPVPAIGRARPDHRRIAALAIRLRGEDRTRADAYVVVQALAARAYGLGRRDFAYVLDSLPLVDPGVRRRCLDRFDAL